MEVTNILKNKNMCKVMKKVLVIKSQLGKDGLQLIKTFAMQKEKY